MNKNSIRQSIFADKQAVPSINILSQGQYKKATSQRHIDLALDGGEIKSVATHRDDKGFIDRLIYRFDDGLSITITYEHLIPE